MLETQIKKGGQMGESTRKVRVGFIASIAILLILFLLTAQVTANGPGVNPGDKKGTISMGKNSSFNGNWA